MVSVELDTIQSPEFQDIDDNHVGVDVNSLVSVNSSSAGFYDDRTGEFRNLILVSGEATQAWVDYDGDAKRIDVTLAPVGTKKPRKPLVSASADLSTVITDVAYRLRRLLGIDRQAAHAPLRARLQLRGG